MTDGPMPESPDELPKHFVVRLERQGKVHFVFCEASVSFDESKLFENGAKALQQMFAGFHRPGLAEVAVLPPLGDPAWMLRTATIQLGEPDGGD